VKAETPLRAALREPIDAQAIRRMWLVVDRRWQPQPGYRRRFPRSALASCVMLAAALLAAFLIAANWRARPFTRGPLAPLALDDGRPVPKLVAPPHGSANVRFDEGSQLEMQPGAVIEPLVNAPDAVTWLLLQGRITFDVKPGGPRRWSIESGLATVEVVGTRLTLERVDHQLIVEVEHGIVLVRGERVPNRVQRLTAGERLALHDEHEDLGASTLPHTLAAQADSGVQSSDLRPAQVAPSVPRAANQVAAASDAARTGTSRDRAKRDGATPDGETRDGETRDGETRDDAVVDDLLKQSDDARSAGRLAAAASVLAELVRVHASNARTPAAAFTLGKIRLDGLGDASGAASAFNAALRLGLPAELEEDAYLRLVEARSRAGDEAGARAAAEAYETRYPGGSRRAAMERWLGHR
jgi:transmembrane sensor